MKYRIAGLALGVAGLWLLFGVEPQTNADQSTPQAEEQAEANPSADLFGDEVEPFLDIYCAYCHTGDKAKAKYRVDDISEHIAEGKDTVRWEKALEMIGLGDMPPSTAKLQPSDEEREAITEWISGELKKIGRGKLEETLLHPSQGNRVDHDELFTGKHMGPAWSPPRLWRLSPQAYSEMLSFDGSDATLAVLDGHGFKDYASLVADEAAVSTMLQTTDIVASFMLGEDPVLKRKSRHGGHRSRLEDKPNQALIAFVNTPSPTQHDYKVAVQTGFYAVFQRDPDVSASERYYKLLKTTSEQSNHRLGVKTMLRAMMMSSEFMFRMELGLGEQLPDGRRMLSPMELAYAVGFAILDSGPDQELIQAAEGGRLQTKADVEREVRRLLAIQEDPGNRLYQMKHVWWRFKPEKARLLRFFREYFGYAEAPDVFKDNTRALNHYPDLLVRDADQLVLYAIEQDKQVLEFLLTTDKYFVSYFGAEEGYYRWRDSRRNSDNTRIQRKVADERKAGINNPSRYGTQHIAAYGLDPKTWNYEPVQPFKQPVPRAGILTHPAWLVAHSGNFDNDIVRRGKWVREHLLAEVVPELPIGVDAQLSTDKTKTLRERFEMKVYADACWRCHKKMNPLGDPFEMYNDFGQYRNELHYDHEGKIVGSPKELFQIRRQAGLDRNAGKPEYETTSKPVNTTGLLDATGDPNLDGNVEDAIDLMRRLGKSERARQSFVRHAFRFWMGRNETLDDSPTLIAADQAYVESDGSFTELLVSLLTSDSFLYRKDTN